MFDLLIHGGTVIDGTKQPRFQADVGIRDDRIVSLGNLAGAEARRRIDATGKIVAPGFIDVHTHADGWMLKTPHLESKTWQGFTTEALMVDGISYAPVSDATAREWLYYLRALDGLRMDEYRGWKSIADFMALIDGNNVQNAVAHIPYANVRSLAAGFGRAPLDDFQLRTVRTEIRKAMEEGAVGLSTGIDYIVQCFSTTDEIVDACKVVAEFGGLYVTHMRYKMGLMPALAEAIEIGKRSGVKVHISHLKAPSPREAEEVLEYIDKTARHEVDFSFDVYPYQPGSTMLNYLLPYEVWEDGPISALSKLRQPDIRARFREGLSAYQHDFDCIRIAWVAGKENSVHQGKLLSDYVREVGVSAEDAILNLLLEERLGVLMVVNEGDDSLVEPFLKHDLHMMGTDGIFTEDGPVHPRQFGSTGRFLGPCVRDRKLFALEEAVHKLSGKPAERFGLLHRGLVREGAFADLVIFDADRIVDRATFGEPRQYNDGIDTVLVNGIPIIENGTTVEFGTPTRPGRALRFQKDS